MSSSSAGRYCMRITRVGSIENIILFTEICLRDIYQNEIFHTALTYRLDDQPT